MARRSAATGEIRDGRFARAADTARVIPAVAAMKPDEAKFHQIILAAFEETDDYLLVFQRAVKAVMKETGLDGVEARWIVMRLGARSAQNFA